MNIYEIIKARPTCLKLREAEIERIIEARRNTVGLVAVNLDTERLYNEYESISDTRLVRGIRD